MAFGDGDLGGEAAPLPPPDFVQLMLAREQAGEISRSDGVLEGLRILAGETAVDQVYQQPVRLHAGYGLARMARQLLAESDDPSVQAETERLLNKVFPTAEAMGPFAAPAETVLQAKSAHRSAYAPPPQSAIDCRTIWEEGFNPLIEEPPICVLYDTALVGDDTLRVYYPIHRATDPGFMQAANNALQALLDSHTAYSPFADVPSIDLVFTNIGSSSTGPDGTVGVTAMAGGVTPGRACPISVYPSAWGFEPDQFKQIIAHEVFHCVQDQRKPAYVYEDTEWYIEGTAEYFSNVVYPKADLEHTFLTAAVVNSALFPVVAERMAYSNYLFMQYLENCGLRLCREHV